MTLELYQTKPRRANTHTRASTTVTATEPGNTCRRSRAGPDRRRKRTSSRKFVRARTYSNHHQLNGQHPMPVPAKPNYRQKSSPQHRNGQLTEANEQLIQIPRNEGYILHETNAEETPRSLKRSQREQAPPQSALTAISDKRSESTLTTESVQTSSPRTYLRKAISALQLRAQKSNSKSQGRRWPRVHERVVPENDVARSIPQMPSLTNSASIQLSVVGIDGHQLRAHQASFCHVFEGRLHRCVFAAVNLHLNSSVPRDEVAFLPIVVLECVKFLKSESTHPLPTTFWELC